MNRSLYFIFLILLVWSAYHLVRDILQIFGIQHYFIDIGHRSHVWCAPYCAYITLAPEIFNIAAIGVVLKRNKVGLLGIIVLLSIPVWLLMWVLK